MPQDRETGAAANQFGRKAARKIADYLSVRLLSKRDNKIIYKNKTAVIKSARYKNPYIGITLKMLEQIDCVIAALQNPDGAFDLYRLEANTFKYNYRISVSGKIALVKRNVFSEKGEYLDTLCIDNVI